MTSTNRDGTDVIVWWPAGVEPVLQPVGAATPLVARDDRGFRYGDGIFETMRVFNGRLPLLPAHLARMRRSLAYIGFPEPHWDDATLARLLSDLLHNQRIGDGYVRLTVTRGSGSRGYEAQADAKPLLFAEASAWSVPARLYETGMTAVVAPFLVSAASPLCRVKSLSALDKVMARTYAQQHGAAEALLLNTDGNVAEGAATNVFIVKEKHLFTPSLASGPLPGVARELVLRLAGELGYTTHETTVTLPDVTEADEVFVTNALILAAPLVSLDGQPLGAGAWPVTTALRARALAQLTAANK